MFLDRRRCKRYIVNVQGVLTYDGIVYPCYIKDISILGIGLVSSVEMHIYDEFSVKGLLFPSDTQTFEFECSVRNIHNGIYGCQFNSLNSKEIQRLSKVIYEMYYK